MFKNILDMIRDCIATQRCIAQIFPIGIERIIIGITLPIRKKNFSVTDSRRSKHRKETMKMPNERRREITIELHITEYTKKIIRPQVISVETLFQFICSRYPGQKFQICIIPKRQFP